MVAKTRARYGIVYSFADIAGTGMAERLKEIVEWRKCRISWEKAVCFYNESLDSVLAGFPEDDIYFDFLDEVLDVNAYIVLSRHSSESKTPTLSIHHTGNPGPQADYGGNPRELSFVLPRLSKKLFIEYYRAAEEEGLLGEYVFTLEATHHGPTSLAKPLVFIEIGSSEEKWRDKRAQLAAALAVQRTIAEPVLPDCYPVIGVGGTHYPEKHTKLMLRDKYCYGHIFAKYVLRYLDEELLEQAVAKSLDPIRGIVLLKVPSAIKKLVKEFAAKKGLGIEIFK